MTAPTQSWAPPQKVGDSDPSVALAKGKLAGFSYGGVFAAQANRTPIYTAEFGTALRTFQQRRNDQIDHPDPAKRSPGPKMNTDGILDWATKKQLRILPDQLVPVTPPPPPALARHAALVFRGTGGVIDHDYVYEMSRQAGTEIIYLDFPASMGGLPPGAANQPSAQDAIQIGYRSAAAWIRANPTRTFLLYGYSLGEVVVARILEALFTPGGELYAYRQNYVASVHIGPPARPLGGAFFGGTAAPGVGIASHRLPAAIYAELGPRACYLCDPDDMYGSIPVPIEGGTGDIMETVYDMVTELALNQFLDTIGAMLPHILEIAQDAGVFAMLGLGNFSALSSPQTGVGGLAGGLLGGSGAGVLGGLLGGIGGLFNPLALVGMLLPVFTSALPGLIAGATGKGGALTGPAAAAQAAVLGMKFLFAGTRPHIEYHIREVWPGQTYFGLGVQHARHWAAAVPVRR